MRKSFIPLTLSLFVLASCSFGPSGSSQSKESRKEAQASEFYSAVYAAPEFEFTTATLTAFYINEQSDTRAIDEQGLTCTYQYDSSSKDFEVVEDHLGQHTSTFRNAPNTVVAPLIGNLFDSLSRQLSLGNPVVHYYLEGGMAAKLTGKIAASTLDPQIEGQFDFSLDILFNEYGLVTSYDCLNVGTFTYEKHEFNYSDHSGFTVRWGN